MPTDATIAVMISWFNQYVEWPYVVKGLRHQTTKPLAVFLCIDDTEMPPPDLSLLPADLPVHICRSDTVGGYDKQWKARKEAGGKALAQNRACERALKMGCNVMVKTDGDCIFQPHHIKIAKHIFEGKLTEWSFTQVTGRGLNDAKLISPKGLYRIANPWEEIYVGPRCLIPTADKLRPDMTWNELDALSTHSWKGFRGRPDGSAAMLGCNMIFPLAAWEFASFPLVRREDACWYQRINQKFKGHPAPDNAYVLHMGPGGGGQWF